MEYLTSEEIQLIMESIKANIEMHENIAYNTENKKAIKYHKKYNTKLKELLMKVEN